MKAHIDGSPIEFAAGETIVEAARRANIDIELGQ